LELSEKAFALFEEFRKVSDSDELKILGLSEWRIRYLEWLSKALWRDQYEFSILDLSVLIGVFFYDLDESWEKQFLSYPQEIQAKNFAGAAMAVLLAITIGYEDMGFLKEYYKTILFMDYPFSVKTWSRSDKSELIERRARKTVSSSDPGIRKIYEDHVEAGIADLRHSLINKSLSGYLRWSFEGLDGNGFLLNITDRELSDLDAITLFCHALFPFACLDKTQKINLKETLKHSLRDEMVLSHRLKDLLQDILKEEEEEEEEEEVEESSSYLEIVGL